MPLTSVVLYAIFKVKMKKEMKKMDVQGKNLKLLIVDDVDEICEFVQSYFRRRGFNVFVAGSAENALSIIKEQSPDIMLLDMNLPGMNGVDLLRAVRRFNATVKVIMISGCPIDLQNAPQFKGLNILEFIHKPVPLSVLDSVLEKINKEANAQEQA